MIRISAWLAVVFGLALAVLEAVRNWGDWQWWPFWVVDYVAATLLVVGGVLVLRRGPAHWLTAGWGFACAMFWMSFFGHFDEVLRQGAAVGAREQRLTLIIGIMFGLTMLGFVTALAGTKNARR
ncbi:hypothetical protein [Phenylobacterium sp. RIFCSPHIGHO2_01_FULL_69_31]|uniref:hypothetical protein n=1 Tax=Phenylobacterium sp. RIFCSPHIGHO2_01_FULL_69_31 TaxID=1801944 RepID=UPI0025EBFB3A|nr:hypothetical protein [Phenylobacterium sp. RIFCSPHIGHO2_01_FULL_69_31]